MVAFMKKKSEEEGKKVGIKLVLDQEPGESSVYKFARLDMQYFPKEAAKIVHGNKRRNEIYYSNSSQLDVMAEVDVMERIQKEGLYHTMMQGGALTHIWLGESRPNPVSMASLIKKVFDKTVNAQVAFSPDFTLCSKCGQTMRGMQDRCSHCKSCKVDWVTRITGYYSFVRQWNKGKVGELKDRYRNLKLKGK